MNVRVASVFAFIVVFFAVGVPYWQIPYSQLSLPSALYGFGLVVVMLLAAVLRVTSKASLIHASVVVGLAVPAMALARVVVDTFKDPTSHNLWPLELVIAAGVGVPVAVIGALVGGLWVSVLRRGSSRA